MLTRQAILMALEAYNDQNETCIVGKPIRAEHSLPCTECNTGFDLGLDQYYYSHFARDGSYVHGSQK